VAENKKAPDSNIGVPPKYAKNFLAAFVKNFLAAFVKNFLTACSAAGAAAHFPALPAHNADLGLNNSDILLSNQIFSNQIFSNQIFTTHKKNVFVLKQLLYFLQTRMDCFTDCMARDIIY
jgi:hypothetical protein